MTLRELDTVVLDKDLPEHELRRGDLGAVVHVYDDTTIEVEFVRASGQTQALVRLPIEAIRASRCRSPGCAFAQSATRRRIASRVTRK